MTQLFATILVLGFMVLFIIIGVPIFVSLGLSGAIGLIALRGSAALTLIPMNIIGHLNNFTLLSVPLFIFMAEAIMAIGLAKDIFTAAQKWLNKLPAPLAIASIGACTMMGALSGSMSASIGGIGSMAIPEMLDRKYSPRLAVGSVACASGLAFIIPPSQGFILYGWLTDTSVGKLFIAGIIPGLLLAFALATTVFIMVRIKPDSAPGKEEATWEERWSSLAKIWPAVVLVGAVMVTIYTGVCTPTEAAGVASFVALVIAGVYYRKLNFKTLKQICMRTARSTCTLGILVASASLFGNFLALIGLPQKVSAAITGLDMGAMGVCAVICFMFFVAGVFFDGMAVMMIVLPILKPALYALNVNMVWFGVLVSIMMAIGVISPPFAVNLFMIKGMVPQLETKDIFLGVIPYMIAMLVVVVLLFIFPGLCTCLI
ncbi:MAG: TRAP transporter large permease [Firmicutes bacterium]|nr:TRAP transporter large permease [Bacillota bacterium]